MNMHRIRYDLHAGVEIVIEEIPGAEKITLASAENKVQKIQNIGKPGQYSALLNAGFFCDQRSSTLYGEAYGVRCVADKIKLLTNDLIKTNAEDFKFYTLNN